MLIVVEGIDASGKSTAAREVVQVLAASVDALHVDKKAIGPVAPEVAARAEALRDLIWAADAPSDPLGASHWILLIASWYAAVDRVQPLFSAHEDRVLIVDGWYYRNIAKTIVRTGLEERWLDSLFATAVRPDIVVWLDVEPEVAWSRRSSFADIELGRWDGFEGEPYTAFCGYQARVRQELRRMSLQRGWIRVAPRPTLGPSAVAEAVVEQIRPRLGLASSRAGDTTPDRQRAAHGR